MNKTTEQILHVGYVLSTSVSPDWVKTVKSRLPTWQLFKIRTHEDKQRECEYLFGIPKEMLDSAKENDKYSEHYSAKWVTNAIKSFWTTYYNQLDATKCVPMDKSRVLFMCIPKGTRIL